MIADDTISSDVLEKAPTRATRLLTGLGALPTVRTALFNAGMTDADIEEGRKLLLAVLAAPVPTTPDKPAGVAVQANAIAELDAWDEPNFQRYGAALKRHYTAAGAYVFNQLTASTGVDAVNGVATFLARLDALEKGSDPARKASHKDDKHAVEFLATRGLPKEERSRLHKLVGVALAPDVELLETPVAIAAKRLDALTQLHQWWEEWSTTAHAVVKKHGHLVRLGLAKRHKPSAKKKKAPPSAGNPSGSQDPSGK